jgi:hypothetical protein
MLKLPTRTSINRGKESTMDSVSERASSNARRGREEEKREVEFYVRAKTGPGKRDWTTIGVALKRRNNEPGFSVKLNTLPISKDWDGGLILVPPYQAEADDQQDD